MKKKIFLGLSIPFILIIIYTIYFQYHAHQSIPVLQGERKLLGLKEKVEVITDEFGIPHISAQNEEDLYFALGFVIAKERLFQMEMLRRIGSGRLSEVLGPTLVPTDRFLRTLRLRKTMEEFVANNKNTFDPQMIKLTDQFYAGVNHFIKSEPLPPEFTLLGFKPEPFSLEDSLAASGYMALSFAEGMIGDLLLSELESEFGEKAVKLLRLGADGEGMPRPDSKIDGAYQAPLHVTWDSLIDPLNILEENFGLFHGSNSFILSGKRTLSGKPILSNDPHVAFSAPGTWFEAHIKCPTFEIYGHFLPLVPFANLGHNQKKAWAVTMAEVDDLDLYLETRNEKGEVLIDKQWHPLIVEEETIKVRFGKDQKFLVKRSPHGPLLDDTIMGSSDPNKSIALAWSYYHPENNVLTAFYKLNRAQNVQEFRKALSFAAAPAINISWVDEEGHIAWQVMSKIPLRNKGVESDKLLNGKDPNDQYLGYVPFEKNPHAEDPGSGVIISTNYRPPYIADYPLDGYWQPSERYFRLSELLKTKEKWTIEDLKSVMTDENTFSHKQILPTLLTSLKSTNISPEWQKRFEDWDGASDLNSKISPLYHLWCYWIMKMTFEDEMGSKRYEAFTKIADFWHTFKNHLKLEDSPWWDNKTTKIVETRSEIIQMAFKKALESTKDKLGSDENLWKWGNLHTVTYHHPLAKIPGLGKIFDIGPIATGGGFFQVNNMSSPRIDDQFGVTLGPSTRRLVDMNNPSESLGILPLGNSGHYKSPFYSDQAVMFTQNIFRRQEMNISTLSTKKHWQLLLIP
jgi:penicillin amidase